MEENTKSKSRPRDYYYYPAPDRKIEVKYVEEDGLLKKVTREYLIQKYPAETARRIKERQKWGKFGQAVRTDNCTSTGEDIQFEFNPLLTGVSFNTKKPEIKKHQIFYYDEEENQTEVTITELEVPDTIIEDTKKESSKKKIKKITCRHCGGPHWSAKCKEKNQGNNQNQRRNDNQRENRNQRGYDNQRRNDNQRENENYRPRYQPREPPAKVIKVDDLDTSISEREIRYYLEEYGHIKHLHVVKNRQTGQSAGYCFVTYSNQSDADYAHEKIPKKAIGYTYPSTEWAKPRY